MKSRMLIVMLAATALAALLLLPGAAPARVRPANRHPSQPLHTVPPSVSEQFALAGTNGFEVMVSVTDRRQLRLTALKFGNVIQSAGYSVPLRRGRGSDDIVARLGRLGRIDARFVPGKVRREKPPEGCRGGKTVIERGHFVGVIAFRGERGFTEVHSRRAAGGIFRTPALQCPVPGAAPNLKKLLPKLEALEHQQEAEEAKTGEEDGLKSLQVRLTATARGGHVSLSASKSVIKLERAAPFSLLTILALGKRQRGPIKEESAAGYLFGKGSTFLVPNRKKPASEGVLKPPVPFSGSATFRRHPKKPPTWTGDLKIDLPGFGSVRLAGPGTHASMCSGMACILRGIASDESLLRRLP